MAENPLAYFRQFANQSIQISVQMRKVVFPDGLKGHWFLKKILRNSTKPTEHRGVFSQSFTASRARLKASESVVPDKSGIFRSSGLKFGTGPVNQRSMKLSVRPDIKY